RGVRDHHFGQSDDGIERRAKLVAHAGDELRLVLVRLCELATLVLDFVEQPHVLDRDHRLVGEGGHQLDLLVGKWADGAFNQHDHANRLAFTQQRNTEHRTVVADFRWLFKLVFRIGENVGYLNDSAFKRGPAGDSSSSQLDWIVPHILDKRRRVTVASDLPVGFVLLARNGSQVRLAQPRRLFDPRIQDRLQNDGGGAEDVQQFGGGPH